MMDRKSAIPDYPTVLLALLLSVYGILMVYSAGQTDAQTAVSKLWRYQTAWLCLGIVGAFVISRASVRLLEWVSWPAYLLTLALLVLLRFFGSGAGTAASSTAWLTIGGHRIGQPSELAKITVVLMLARTLALRREAPKTLIDLWEPALVVAIPWVFVLIQPDLGSSIVFIGIFFAMLYWFGVPWQLLLLLASPGISLILAFSKGMWTAWFLVLIVLIWSYKPYLWEGVFTVCANVAMGIIAPLFWDRLKPYQQQRLLTFLDPSRDPRVSGYHVIQSTVAIGSGGWFGKGFTMGTQKRLAFLPEQHTDFIFAVVGEELGFLGVTLALSLFLVLFLRCVRISSRANDTFSSLVAFGLAASWGVHVAENVGMTLNLMPIAGIPLPFFSYGGSFMLASWLAIGILVRISGEGRGRADGLAI
ncbi:MAG TPA: rod shape-determining protein RodA [Gemmatimonadaceae bacterium]|nr:rod shape-determining protein RodA [Gemmatimonadaceae bacterium]